MKTLYLDCSMGAAGDMLTAALLELIDDRASFVKKLNELGIPDVEYTAEPAEKCGITGTYMKVTVSGVEEGEEHHHHHDHDHDHEHHHDHDHEHHHDHEHSHEYSHDEECVSGHHHDHDHDHEHHHDHDHDHEHEHGHHHHGHSHNDLHGISHIVNDHLNVSESVKKDIMAVYGLIADAESQVHGKPVDQIHFHEVGTMDAVADVAAVCLLMEEIAPDQVIASDVHVGSGTVKCAHGILPVPAPATALILKGIPVYSGAIRGELCTPTGAALLKHFVNKFEAMPHMTIEKIGYGMGKKDFPQANCVRAILGETKEDRHAVMELSCYVDDMTAEDISFACEQLFAAGAREVYTIAIGMKKSRPGTLIRAICTEEKREDIISCMFRTTTTLGIRQTDTKRYTLQRHIEKAETEFGPIRLKRSSGYGVQKMKYEHDDLAAIAEKTGMTLDEVRAYLDEKKLFSL